MTFNFFPIHNKYVHETCKNGIKIMLINQTLLNNQAGLRWVGGGGGRKPASASTTVRRNDTGANC